MLDHPLQLPSVFRNLNESLPKEIKPAAGSEPRQQDHLDRFKSSDKVTQEGFHLCLLPAHAL